MSMRCCFPVKNGWQLEHTSTWSSGFVEPVTKVLPQAHVTFAWTYLGWIFSFMSCLCFLCLRCLRDDVHFAAVVARRAVGDLARDEREQRVVLADTDVLARQNLRAALTHEHRAGLDDRAAELLHAEPLPGRVATVAGRTRALLVCH